MAEQGARLLTPRLTRIGGMLLVCSFLLAVIGPFNTFGTGGFGWRLLYWAVLVLISVPLAGLLRSRVALWLPGSVFVREAITIALFSAMFTPIVIFWTDLVPVGSDDRSLGVSQMFLYIVAICLAISAIRYGGPELTRFMASESGTLSAAGADDALRGVPYGPPRLARRLPEGISGPILRLSADGHVVNVLTTEGRFDLRMRLGDAIDEIDGVDGLTVHRSHWVARAAIAGSKRERGRVVLVLVTGDEVPVGPTFRPQLEEAGIL